MIADFHNYFAARFSRKFEITLCHVPTTLYMLLYYLVKCKKIQKNGEILMYHHNNISLLVIFAKLTHSNMRASGARVCVRSSYSLLTGDCIA